jgi:hypothetical protein
MTGYVALQTIDGGAVGNDLLFPTPDGGPPANDAIPASGTYGVAGLDPGTAYQCKWGWRRYDSDLITQTEGDSFYSNSVPALSLPQHVIVDNWPETVTVTCSDCSGNGTVELGATAQERIDHTTRAVWFLVGVTTFLLIAGQFYRAFGWKAYGA